MYEKTIEAHLRKPFGKLKVSAIDTDRLKRYRVEREKAGFDPVTVNRELSYLRGAMRRAMKEGTIQTVPYSPMVKENNARKVFHDEPDFLRFLGLLGDDLKSFAATGYYGGLRRGELRSANRNLRDHKVPKELRKALWDGSPPRWRSDTGFPSRQHSRLRLRRSSKPLQLQLRCFRKNRLNH